MLAAMSSQELSGWMALMRIHAEEAQRQRDIIESGDGQVFEYGKDDEDEDDGGPTE